MCIHGLSCTQTKQASSSFIHFHVFSNIITFCINMASIAKTVEIASGVHMPRLGFGTYSVDDGHTAVKSAIEMGYQHIDCATLYDNEAKVGQAVSEMIKRGFIKRDKLFLTGKLWSTHHHPAHVKEQLQETLQNLQVSYIDLYLIHHPVAVKYGSNVLPVDENDQAIFEDVDYIDTWKAMEKMVDEGLTRSIGVSNFNSKQLQRIEASGCRIKPAVLQVEINPFQNNEKLVRYAQERDIVVTGYSPFGSPARPWAEKTDPDVFRNSTLLSIARNHMRMVPQIIQRWVLQRDCTVLAKSDKPNRIRSNLQVDGFELSEDEMNAINGLHCGYRAHGYLQWTQSPHYPFTEEEA